jgi:hypothetical protein
MHGIPKDLNLDDLIGENIQRIDVGPYIIHLKFSNNRTISCEGEIRIKGNETNRITCRNWENINSIKEVLLKNIQSWQITNSKTFMLNLSDDVEIHFTDDSDKYERFQIYPEGYII